LEDLELLYFGIDYYQFVNVKRKIVNIVMDRDNIKFYMMAMLLLIQFILLCGIFIEDYYIFLK